MTSASVTPASASPAWATRALTPVNELLAMSESAVGGAAWCWLDGEGGMAGSRSCEARVVSSGVRSRSLRRPAVSVEAGMMSESDLVDEWRRRPNPAREVGRAEAASPQAGLPALDYKARA